MPSYDYSCPFCGFTREEFHRDPRLAPKELGECPRCFTNTATEPIPKLLRRIGPGAGVIFRGSGFYATDYRQVDSPDTLPYNEKRR